MYIQTGVTMRFDIAITSETSLLANRHASSESEMCVNVHVISVFRLSHISGHLIDFIAIWQSNYIVVSTVDVFGLVDNLGPIIRLARL